MAGATHLAVKIGWTSRTGNFSAETDWIKDDKTKANPTNGLGNMNHSLTRRRAILANPPLRQTTTAGEFAPGLEPPFRQHSTGFGRHVC